MICPIVTKSGISYYIPLLLFFSLCSAPHGQIRGAAEAYEWTFTIGPIDKHINFEEEPNSVVKKVEPYTGVNKLKKFEPF